MGLNIIEANDLWWNTRGVRPVFRWAPKPGVELQNDSLDLVLCVCSAWRPPLLAG